ncbi:MAG: glutamine--tRNA ligase/YqeY domain fusion protein [Flavobacteriales bacterium]|nr:glutamine--tRNA ligase/YqeY domain fusion protein [Flavobacteriales bacterium]
MDSATPDMPVEGNEEGKTRRHFIQQIIDADREEGLHGGRVHTRFPPEPNGYLHIGHAKAICVNFGLAAEYGGTVNLRFDDTNPVKEDTEYVNAIREDIAWLGFEWNGGEHYTSDYFETLYGYAVKLIEDGKAYVDEQSAEDIAAQKGTPTSPGTASPFRDRPVEENLRLFAEMREGKHEEGSMVLRAKIDMAHANMHMRDPFMYRIKFAHHHRTGDAWCIYPMYDFAHGQSDSLEGITHSLCSLEFENHRPLYDWYIENLGIFPSKQREFARLNLNYTIMSKRKLLRLVEEGVVDGWDDLRMPTLSGLRRRGYTPESIREFCDRVGVAKRNNVIDVGLLEFALRNHLNATATRAMAVLRPIKLVVTNYPEGQTEWLPTENNPEDASAGTRELPFSRELYIEADDFKVEGVNKKWFRLAPGRSVRLKSAYIVTYVDHVTDASGNVTEVHVEYHPNSKSGSDTSGIKAKGTLHWVECNHAADAEVRLYDRLFSNENPDGHKDRDFMEFLNPESLEVLTNCKVEPVLADAQVGTPWQFTRLGYFTADSKWAKEGKLVFNRAVTLKDGWKG